MSDNSTKTVTATFQTREGADLAIEHMVQHAGLDRADIFVEAGGHSNSSGIIPNGGDAPSVHHGARMDAALGGEIIVLVMVRADQIPTLHRIFGDAGAIHVSSR